MFSKAFPLFTIFGFQVKLDASWLLLAILITWSLAVGYFPEMQPGMTTTAYWSMGILGLLGLAASIVLHELAHALVARRYDMPIRGITLFIFGGVAEMEDEAASAKGELLMALAGPAMSIALAGVFYLAGAGAVAAGAPVGVVVVLGYLALINLLLAVFNMVPAFPLDGGRVLRAALWAWKGDVVRATRIASAMGTGFGILLVVLGLYSFITGNVIAGVWWFLIGLFVRAASAGALQRTLSRDAFAGMPVRRFMRRDPVAVDPDLPLDRFVDDYVYRHYYKSYPVVRDGRLVGCVDVEDVKSVDRGLWAQSNVAAVMQPCDDRTVVDPDADAAKALERMRISGKSRLIVARGGRLEGVVALRDLINFLQVRLDLGESPSAERARRAREDASHGHPSRG